MGQHYKGKLLTRMDVAVLKKHCSSVYCEVLRRPARLTYLVFATGPSVELNWF
jgi:hypothetical protein